jgi:hypothetical protein
MKTPEGIERLAPGEAYQDGYRQGREDLAHEMQRDALAAAASESAEAKRALDDRLAKMEGDVRRLQGEAEDNAGVVRNLATRTAKLEGRTPITVDLDGEKTEDGR